MKIVPDTKQKIMSFFYFFGDIYKMLTGSFLSIFVPRTCSDTNTGLCSLRYNIQNREPIHFCALITNCINFCVFLLLFCIEIIREYWCIKNLDINEDKSQNNLDVEIENYPELKQNLYKINLKYKLITLICIFSQILNVSISLIDLFNNNFSLSSSGIPMLSFIFLVILKLKESYIASTNSLKKEKVYSAFLVKKIIYNEIDKDIISLSNIKR